MSEQKNNRGGGMPLPKKMEVSELDVENQELQAELSEDQEKALKGIHSHPDKKLLLKAEGKINVVAIQAGYYGNFRYKEGDKFTIPNKAQIGSWMKVI